jgi:ribosomal subunit interface protein
VEIVVKGRRTEVSDRFRQHVVEKLSRLEKWDGKLISLDVEVSKERNPRLSDVSDRIEITCVTRGPVVRAEAAAGDPYAALDLAYAKLEVRMRKSADRRRVHHGARTPLSVATATATRAAANSGAPNGSALNGHPDALLEDDYAALAMAELSDNFDTDNFDTDSYEGGIAVTGDGPMVVRRKTHRASPMTLDQALYEMELVGHDFYLFVDAETSDPCVVYRRHGYDYGVIRLET